MKSNTKYFIDDIPLKKYCENNNISYKRVYRKIKKEEQNTEKKWTKEELMKIILEVKNTDNSQIKYYFDGIPLINYCKSHSIAYDCIQKSIKKDKSKDPIEIKIKRAIDNYHQNGIKYYFDNIPFKDYCQREKLNYSTGIKLLKEGIDINIVIKKLIKIRNKKIELIIKESLLNNLNNENFLLEFAVNYKLSMKNLKELIKKGIPLGNSVMMIYYFGIPFNNEKIVTKDLMDYVVILREKNKSELNLEELLFLDQIGFIEYRILIKEKMRLFIDFAVRTYISPKEKIYETAYNYLENSIDYILKHNFANVKEFVNYSKKVLYGHLMRFFHKKENLISIEQLQNINSSIDIENDYIQKEISNTLYDVINKLPIDQKKFILLKYGFFDGKIRTNEELITYFKNYTIEKLSEMEEQILKKLYNNEKIKKLNM